MTAVRITAEVQASRKYSTRSGEAVHDLLLSQGVGTPPVLARRRFGSTPGCHLVADRLAHSFRPGQRATVTGAGLDFDAQHQTLVLQRCDHIEAAPAATPEPQDALQALAAL